MASSRSRILLIATAMVWVAAYAAWTADWIIQPMPYLFERSVRRIPTCLFGIALCLGIGAYLRRLPMMSRARKVLIGVALCAVSAVLFSIACAIAFYFIAPLWGSTTVAQMLENALTTTWVFVAWLALYFAIEADADAHDTRIALAEARTAEQRARNQALAQQIHPHFLFNALNAVSGLIMEGDGERAERVTMALSTLLRRSLDQDLGQLVPLAEEIEAQRRYLEIEEVRFEDRIRFVDTVPATLLNCLVPPLILQPLVENAVKYGVARSTGTVTLTISATARDTMLEIVVEDDGKGASGGSKIHGSGIGQDNTRRRAIALFGENASLECGEILPRGYRCTLRLPVAT